MIRVCDIGAFLYCPRQAYLAIVLKAEEERTAELDAARVGHMVRRELSLRQSKLLPAVGSVEEAQAAFAAELKSIIADAPHTFRGQWRTGYGAHLPRIAGEAALEIANLAGEIEAMAEDMGFEEAVDYLTPLEVDCRLSSETLRISGVVDKIMWHGALVPVDVKTRGQPASSWTEDRIQLCSYGMLVEESSGTEAGYGLMDFVRHAKRQPVPFTESLREATLKARDGVEAILDGQIPDVCPHGNPERCRPCPQSGACYRI